MDCNNEWVVGLLETLFLDFEVYILASGFGGGGGTTY